MKWKQEEARFICDSFSIIYKEFFHGGATIFAALCNFNIIFAVICIKVTIENIFNIST